MSVTAKISKVRGLQSIEKRIVKQLKKQADPAIMTAAAKLMRERIIENPEVFVDKAVDILRQMQSTYYGGGGVGNEDPADFDNLPLMELEVIKNLNRTLEVEAVGNTLRWTAVVVSEEFVGFGGNSVAGRPADRGDPDTLPWIAFFLSGTIEEQLLWISDDTAVDLELGIGKTFNHLGRFGKGFLVRRTKGWDGMLKAVGINASSLVHPISGQSGRDWFAGLEQQITSDPRFMDLYVKPAMSAAVKQVLNG